MPDYKVWIPADLLSVIQKEELKAAVRYITAAEMTCKKPDGEVMIIEPEMVDVTIVEVPQENLDWGDTGALLEVGAFDFEDRMRNIDERMKAIAIETRRVLPIGDKHVSWTFDPQPLNCWGSTKVA